MRRTCLVLVALLVSLAGPLTSSAARGEAPPPATSPAAPRPAPFVIRASRTVRLITGDTVRVLTGTDGSIRSTVVAGPHLSASVTRWSTLTESYLMPRTSATVRRRLDVSMYDVEALARLRGRRVPVVVTLDQSAVPAARRAAASTLDLRSTAGSVRGSYPVDFRGLRPSDLAGVRSIRLAGLTAPRRVTGPTHTLTVYVGRGPAHPFQGSVVAIENVDDDRLFLQTPTTDASGTVTAEVPAGDYSVLAWTFGRLVILPELRVADDRAVSLDLADATVPQHVSMPGFRLVEAVLSVGRTADSDGYGFPLEFSGPVFDMRVQPSSGSVAHGTLRTGVSAKLIPVGGGSDQAPAELAVTADLSDGVPTHLSYVHHPRDFARVTQRFYANGPAGLRQSSVDGGGPGVMLYTGDEYDAPTPGRRVVLFQASPHAYYQQTVFPEAPPGGENLTQLVSVSSYLKAGARRVESFAHGPVGPGAETGRYRSVLRRADRLAGYVPLLCGAGTEICGEVLSSQDGSWSLRQGSRVLAHGTALADFDVPVPAASRTFTLTAESHPASRLWTLSTRVRDVWRFHSRRGIRAVPFLTPSYVVPTTLAGTPRPARPTSHCACSGSAPGGSPVRTSSCPPITAGTGIVPACAAPARTRSASAIATLPRPGRGRP